MITPRWAPVAWIIGGLVLGLVIGAAWGRMSATCSTETKDGGLTVTETCTRDVSP